MSIAPRTHARRLLWHGAALFLLGLLTGFVESALRNPRMGLAAHLEGVMNGTFLLAVGAAWPHVRLAPGRAAAAFWLLLYGAYVNWAITLLAAVLGTTAMTPLTGQGFGAAPWAEQLVTVGFGSVGVAMVAATVLLLIGLRGAGDGTAPPPA
ncbi:MAG: hydrogenase [Gemmatimonadetes bacterium]|nr:hydrogenase [Gemmatimonadota bacterium]